MVDARAVLFEKSRQETDLIINVLADLADDVRRKAILGRFEAELETAPKHYEPKLAEGGIFRRLSLMLVTLSECNHRGLKGGLPGNLFDLVLSKMREHAMFSTWPDDGFIHLHPVMAVMNDSGNLKPLIYGFPYLVRTMRRAVPAINVRDGHGDLHCGSGVVLQSDVSGVGVLVTNRHVLEGHEILSVEADGLSFEKVGSETYSDEYDLARFNVRIPENLPRVNLGLDVEILTPVVAMGYPRIPLASGQFIMAHKGEVNGAVQAFDKKAYTVISCHVAPGNSGGPIFTEGGYLAGIVTQSNVAEYADQTEQGQASQTIYHVAIPVDAVRRFISPR